MAPTRQQKHKKTLPFGQQGETHRVSLTRFQQGEDDTGTGYHYQIAAMVSWLEISANFNIIAGNSTSGKKMAHGGGTTKIAGFRSMAEFVHTATVDYMRAELFFDPKLAAAWEAKQCQSRWNSIFRRYRAARYKLDNQTGFGLTEEMVAKGMTVDDLAEESCPCFHRIDALFGAKSNVAPPSEMSEPSYDDADWFPVRENISDKTNIDRCNSMTSSQNSTVNDAGYDQENVSPNAQKSAAYRPLNLINTTEQDHTSQQPTMATIAKPTAKKSTPATKTFKSAAKTKATTAAETKGVDKAMCYKRKDFGSVYTEASKKRQAFNEKKLKVQMQWKEKMLVEERLEKNMSEKHE
ncbi:hypothetical protein GN958_ATG23046 [Phytophthora infestans]|uniref:No apical meristem-associated C-terminal domain-containing protein n=1 Tax=Phytophthora infestans TaxID=4787 RepID=A0A8S9TGW4_PHYIN|nr:hypothetical protein GN958_ATG23046 [Phytophthora infestans]